MSLSWYCKIKNMTRFNSNYLARGKRLMVVFHGMFGDSNDLFDLSSDFPLDSFLFLDLPGHGRSVIHDSDSFDSVVQELFTFISTFNHHSLHFIGYSMGGRFGLYLSLKYPYLFESMVLESSHIGLKEEEREKRIENDSLVSLRMDDEDFFLKWYQQPLFYHYNSTDAYHRSYNRKRAHPVSQFQKAMTLFSTGHQPLCYDVLDQTKKITYLYGEMDKKYVDFVESLKDDHHISWVKILNAGHNTHSEAKIDYLKALKMHFKELR